MPELTPEEYAKQLGVRCPVCGGDECEGDSVEIDAGYARQDITCGDCGATWTDEYTLAGYSNLERETA